MILIQNYVLGLNYNEDELSKYIASKLKINEDNIVKFYIKKKSIDARDKNRIIFVFSFYVELNINEVNVVKNLGDRNVILVTEKKVNIEEKVDVNIKDRIVVVGAGPGGLFASLYLAKMGLNPLLIEQGNDVDKRSEDVDLFWSKGILNSSSDVQFGEGGAGAFSDGKLTTGVNNELCDYVLEQLVEHGAKENILYDGMPHIGTDNLVNIVKNIREHIISLGGEVRFGTKLVDFSVENNMISSIVVESNGKKEVIKTSNVILATGHSAKSVYRLLDEKKVNMECKPFSMGVRIEHLQEDINKSQYGRWYNHRNLKNATYKLSTHLDNGRGIYTFCMCPGGYVVASSSDDGEIVTNGMSRYNRDNINANSALLVSINVEDYYKNSVLDGIEFLSKYERKAYELTSKPFYAPMQLVGDFLEDKMSTKLGKVKPSYLPGCEFAMLKECLPDFVYESLKEALPILDRKLKGFASKDAIMIGVETRTSAPLRILRDETHQSSIKGLYPCGEGAGYAGGIVTSAADGVRCAKSLINNNKS